MLVSMSTPVSISILSMLSHRVPRMSRTLLSAAMAAMLLVLSASSVWAAEHASWTAYMKANRYKCPGPFDTLASPRSVTLAGKTYEHQGSRLVISSAARDADAEVKLGVLSAIKDVTPGTKANIAAAVKWFRAEGVEWIVANGDLALEEFDLAGVVEQLGETGMPVLVVLGNSESKGSWARTYKKAVTRFPNIINGTWIRQIIADDVEFWTMPGYHDKRFVHQGAGCRYDQEDVRDLRRHVKAEGSAPVVLIAHGPPQGVGAKALDRIVDKKNVGDPMLNDLIKATDIPFGIFGHILEAGGAAVGGDMRSTIRKRRPSPKLYVNAGSTSGDPWGQLDGSTSYGMAMIFTLKAGKAAYDIKRFKYTPPED